MSKDSEPESRPISVSELLARSQAAGGTTPTRRDGRGRRRAGRDGSVSVSELTGEIPKITDAPATQADEKPASADENASAQTEPAVVEASEVEAPQAKTAEVEQPEAEPAETASTPEPSASEPSAPESSARTESPSGPFPRSGNPVARRAADDRPVADRSRPDRPFASSGRNASGMPGYGEAPPATRDFSSDSVARRMSPPRDSEPVDEESANAVTGIIPVVEGSDEGLVVVESDDVVTYDLNEVDSGSDPRERADGGFSDVMDFDAYRNFADVEGDTDTGARPAAGTSGPKKGAKALGGLARKLFSRKAAGAAAGTAASVAASTPGTDSATSSAPGGRARAAAARARDDENPTEIIEPIASPGDAAHDEAAAGDTRVEETRPAETDETEAWQASAQWYDTEAWSAPVVDEEDDQPRETPEPAAEPEPVDKPDTARLAETADLDETPGSVADGPAEDTATVAGTTPPELEEAAKPAVSVGEADEAETDEAETREAETREADTEDERSPAAAWLLIFGQAVVGLVVGIGLFWGFTELWRWNPYFALVLAVLVIFGIVTLSHVVRRTKDLTTTLLALGVGLLVTIGPLVLLAT
ncbi:hypothetical protein QEN40_07660 [Gordonia alkanivorans]|uniref:hypothetical protein n=1 Tax=Gordonia alkanivorans TaxID=84096 RepID=UPI002446A09E|nr:hypothetical protein [Gordonia alkanivorans]MDH3016014.1 hypothetical protein [Gordonia alkanivorans]MDH3040854.1 hypothetical protein [Gordonia alkanivorans]MDH3059011.1 hypothetical protein [Gordonia alkanivorans]